MLPDRDQAGIKLAEQALEFGWSVSFPEWGEDIKDVNDAVKKYGRIYTLWSIIDSKESNSLAQAPGYFTRKDFLNDNF